MIHDDPTRDCPFRFVASVKGAVPKGGSNCAWNYHRAKKEGGGRDSVTKGISGVRVSKAALHYVQVGPAYYHFHRNRRYGTHKAYRLIDNSPLIMLSRKFPEKERFIPTQVQVSSIFLFVLCTWNTRFNFLQSSFDFFLKGFFLFDGSFLMIQKKIGQNFVFFVFYCIFEVS